jgi:hypothetical protein
MEVDLAFSEKGKINTGKKNKEEVKGKNIHAKKFFGVGCPKRADNLFPSNGIHRRLSHSEAAFSFS